MPGQLRGTEGMSKYGFRVASRFGAWRLEQDDGDDGAIVECDEKIDDELWSTYEPTELRLRIGERWMVYRNVEVVGDTQFRVTGKPGR